MSTMECISSIVLNASTKREYYDNAASLVVPCVMEIFSQQEVDYYDAALMIIRALVNYYENSVNTKESACWRGL